MSLMGLIIRSSSIHAAGCYTTTPLAKGVKVVEYTGPRISKKEADKQYRDSKITYLFGVGDGSMVINGYGYRDVHQPFLRSQLRDRRAEG